MTILVTGGAGFIGSHVVDSLVARGHQVTVFDDLSNGSRKNLNPKAKLTVGKVEDAKTENFVRRLKPQAIFHFAAQKDVRLSVEDPVADASVNVIGILRLIKASLDIPLKRFVLASTGGAIYGGAETVPTPEDHPTHPFSPYGVAKLASENYLDAYRHAAKLPAVSLRFANVYGPRQSPESESGVTAIFTKKMLEGERPTIYGDGKQTRDFVYVGDIAAACLKALGAKRLGTYNIGTGTETSVNELTGMLAALIGTDKKPIYAPGRSGEERRSALAIGRAKKELGWEPQVALAQGLAKTVVWQKSVLKGGKWR